MWGKESVYLCMPLQQTNVTVGQTNVARILFI